MIMADIKTLYERESGEQFYPVTGFGAVFDSNGLDLESRFRNERKTTTAGLAEKATIKQLSAKQEKLTSSADILVSGSQLSLTEQAKFALFVDMWNSACGEYGKYDPENAPDPEHPFYLNELWLTYEESVEIYNISIPTLAGSWPSFYYRYNDVQLRTFLPMCGNKDSEWHSCFANNKKLEVLRVRPGRGILAAYAIFRGCSNLRKVLGPFNCFQLSNTLNSFSGCVNLEYIELMRLGGDIKFSDSPKLSIETFIYINKNVGSFSSKGITITVHPDVYAKLTGDTTNDAAAALTPDELAAWQQVLADAVEKNISFATV